MTQCFIPATALLGSFLFRQFLHCWTPRHHVLCRQIQIHQRQFLHCYSHAFHLLQVSPTAYLLCSSAEVSSDGCKWKEVF